MSGFTNIIEADNFCVYIKNVGNIAKTIFPEYRGIVCRYKPMMRLKVGVSGL